MDQADGDRTLTDGRGNAFHRPVPDIADREDARHAAFEQAGIAIDGPALRPLATGDQVRLEPEADGIAPIELPAESIIVMGVIAARLRFSASGDMAIEEPLA